MEPDRVASILEGATCRFWEESEEEVNLCPICGTEIADGSKWCTRHTQQGMRALYRAQSGMIRFLFLVTLGRAEDVVWKRREREKGWWGDD